MKNRKPKNKEELSATSGKRRINSRNKGNSYERWVANMFKDTFGYRFAKTTRNSSKLLDDCGIDISGIFWNVQAKSGYWSRRPKAEEIFKNIDSKLKDNFDPKDKIHTYPKVLFHKLDGHDPTHHLVTMTFDDWLKLAKIYDKYITGEIQET